MSSLSLLPSESSRIHLRSMIKVGNQSSVWLVLTTIGSTPFARLGPPAELNVMPHVASAEVSNIPGMKFWGLVEIDLDASVSIPTTSLECIFLLLESIGVT